jgi:hypothetical protein
LGLGFTCFFQKLQNLLLRFSQVGRVATHLLKTLRTVGRPRIARSRGRNLVHVAILAKDLPVVVSLFSRSDFSVALPTLH